MTEEKERKERVRKAYSPKGERAQRMVSFRLDNDNQDWLDSKPNKGRYINELIANDRASHQ